MMYRDGDEDPEFGAPLSDDTSDFDGDDDLENEDEDDEFAAPEEDEEETEL